MSNLESYLEARGITDDQMIAARRRTQEIIDSYRLSEARKASRLTQVELAGKMGVSQNRISRMESGDLGTMSLNVVRRYIEALGGSMTVVADLPTGRVVLT